MIGLKFIKGAYNLPPIYDSEGNLPLFLNQGAIVKKEEKYYIIKGSKLEEVFYDKR